MMEQKVQLPVGDNSFIRGTLISPDKFPRCCVPGVLLVHGWCGNEMSYQTVARAIVDIGAVCLTINLRGHGNSDGSRATCTRYDHLEDVRAAYDYLACFERVNRVGALGVSYGAYMLALLTGERELAWLAFRVPALYWDRNFGRPVRLATESLRIMQFRRRRLLPKQNRALRAIARFTGDILIVSSDQDEYIPPQTIYNYVEAAESRARSLMLRALQSNHAMKDQRSREEFNCLLLKWLEDVFQS